MRCHAVSKTTGYQCEKTKWDDTEHALCPIHVKELDHYSFVKCVDYVLCAKFGRIDHADISWLDNWEKLGEITMANTEFHTLVNGLRRKREYVRQVCAS